MKRSFAFLALPLVYAASLVAQPAAKAGLRGPVRLAVRPGDSTVAFTVKKWGVMREQGRFRDFSGTIEYDPARPESSCVSLTVAAASVDTGEPARDETLRSEDFFDIARHPQWTFVSASVRPTGPETAVVAGDITIRGVKRRITVPVKFLGMNDTDGRQVVAGFETAFTLDRTDFGVNGTRWSGGRALLSREVQVHLFLGTSGK